MAVAREEIKFSKACFYMCICSDHSTSKLRELHCEIDNGKKEDTSREWEESMYDGAKEGTFQRIHFL